MLLGSEKYADCFFFKDALIEQKTQKNVQA